MVLPSTLDAIMLMLVKLFIAALLDIILIFGFAFLGRTSHDLSLDVTGVFETAWPFLVGAAVGWMLSRAWRNPLGFSHAFPIWITTIIIGIGLRYASGQGIALPFILVATATTLLLLVGWRFVAYILRRILHKSDQS